MGGAVCGGKTPYGWQSRHGATARLIAISARRHGDAQLQITGKAWKPRRPELNGR